MDSSITGTGKPSSFESLNLDVNKQTVQKLWMPDGFSARKITVGFARTKHLLLHRVLVTNSKILEAATAEAKSIVTDTSDPSQIERAVQVRAIVQLLLGSKKVIAAEGTPLMEVSSTVDELRAQHVAQQQRTFPSRPAAPARSADTTSASKPRRGLTGLLTSGRTAIMNALMDKAVIKPAKKDKGFGWNSKGAVRFFTGAAQSAAADRDMRSGFPPQAETSLGHFTRSLEQADALGFSAEHGSFRASGTAKSICEAIAKLEENPDETVLVPSGHFGHCTAIGVRRQPDGQYSLILYNTGSGIEKRHMKNDEGQTITYWGFCNLPQEAVTDPSLWKKVLHARTLPNPDRTYQAMEQHVKLYGGDHVYDAHPPEPIEFTTEQQRGSCSSSSLWAAMRHDVMLRAPTLEEGHDQFSLLKAGMQTKMWESTGAKVRDEGVQQAGAETLARHSGKFQLAKVAGSRADYTAVRQQLYQELGMQPPSHEPATTAERYSDLRSLTRIVADRWLASSPPDPLPAPNSALGPALATYQHRRNTLDKVGAELRRVHQQHSRQPPDVAALAIVNSMLKLSHPLQRFTAGSMPMLANLLAELPEDTAQHLLDLMAVNNLTHKGSLVRKLNELNPKKCRQLLGMDPGNGGAAKPSRLVTAFRRAAEEHNTARRQLLLDYAMATKQMGKMFEAAQTHKVKSKLLSTLEEHYPAHAAQIKADKGPRLRPRQGQP